MTGATTAYKRDMPNGSLEQLVLLCWVLAFSLKHGPQTYQPRDVGAAEAKVVVLIPRPSMIYSMLDEHDGDGSRRNLWWGPSRRIFGPTCCDPPFSPETTVL